MVDGFLEYDTDARFSHGLADTAIHAVLSVCELPLTEPLAPLILVSPMIILPHSATIGSSWPQESALVGPPGGSIYSSYAICYHWTALLSNSRLFGWRR